MQYNSVGLSVSDTGDNVEGMRELTQISLTSMD